MCSEPATTLGMRRTPPVKPAVSPARQAATTDGGSRILVLRSPSCRKGLQTRPPKLGQRFAKDVPTGGLWGRARIV